MNSKLICSLKTIVDDIENIGASPLTVDAGVVDALKQAIAALKPQKPEAVRLRDELRERAEFEAWARTQLLVGRSGSISPSGQIAWQAWQAAIAATGKQQVGEPKCSDCGTPLLYECTGCSANNYPPQQVGEVQGGDLSLAECITDHLCQHDYDIGGRAELFACVTEALAALQSAGQVVGYVSRDSSKAHMCVNLLEGSPLYAAPPAQAVDLGQLSTLLGNARTYLSQGLNSQSMNLLGDALALIDGQAVSNG